MEKEHLENFQNRQVYTISTEAEIRQHGTPLPMKIVFTRKKGIEKARAVACGNFERDPVRQLWTAQAEISSLICGLRLASLRQWKVGAVDVKGAFMYAPLPSSMLVVVRPPKMFEECGSEVRTVN